MPLKQKPPKRVWNNFQEKDCNYFLVLCSVNWNKALGKGEVCASLPVNSMYVVPLPQYTIATCVYDGLFLNFDWFCTFWYCCIIYLGHLLLCLFLSNWHFPLGSKSNRKLLCKHISWKEIMKIQCWIIPRTGLQPECCSGSPGMIWILSPVKNKHKVCFENINLWKNNSFTMLLKLASFHCQYSSTWDSNFFFPTPSFFSS